MNSARLFSSFIILTILSTGTMFAQAVGDYGSKSTGNWGTTGANWIVCTSAGTWAAATDPAPAAPNATKNVWIRAGHTVNMEVSAKNCLNLTIETGATLNGDQALPNSGIRYLRVAGTTVTINGVFGATTAPGNVMAMEAATTGGTLTITGSGTFGPSRLRVNSSASSATVVFDINTTFYYTGSDGSGGVGLYPATDNNTFTVNTGKMLTFVGNSGFGVASGNGSSTGQSLTVNVYGTIDLSQTTSPLTLRVTTGKTATFIVYPTGSITVGGNVYTSTVADAGTTVMTIDGSLTVGGTVNFSNPSFVMTGTGSCTVPAGTTMSIGHVDGISSSGASGQIQTTTRSFSSGASYSYVGTAAQITGNGLPSTVNNLTINNSNSVSLTNPLTVNGVLTLTSGNITTGANTLATSSTGSVSRTSGHVVGNLQKSVGTGVGVARTFEVGTGADYAPVNVTFANVTTGGSLTGSTTAGEHPNIGTSGIDPSKSVNRYWSLVNSGVAFDTYDGVFNFVGTDIDGGANTGAFTAEKYSGGTWSPLTEGTLGSTSTQILGATSFSDFAVGEGAPVPVFQLSSASINFGNVVVANSKQDSVYVRNTGGTTLNVTTIASDNTPVYTVTPSSAVVAPGDSVKVKVTFSPTSLGAASASIVFTHDAAGSPDTLAVSGNGIAAPPIMSNGTGGGDWNIGSSWFLGNVPLASDNVIIQASDSVYLLAAGTCANLTMNAGTKLALNATGLSIPGTSWTFDAASTVYYNTTTLIQSSPAYGNLVYAAVGSGNAGGNLTINGNLTITTATLRGISGASGTFVHTVAGSVVAGPATSACISAVNNTSATTASCTWNIGGSVSLTGNNSSNKIMLFESAGPHTGTATFNIAGNLNMGAACRMQLRSSTSANSSPCTGTVNIKGNVTNNGTLVTSTGATGSALVIWLNGTGAQSYTGVFPGAFPAGQQTCEVRIDNAAGVVLGSPATINTNVTLNLVNGKLTTTPTNLLTCSANGSITGGGAASFISGPLARAIATGSPTPGFPIGDASNYTPVDLTFGTVSTGGTLTASSTAGEHPQIGTSGIFAPQSVNRYYTISNAGLVFDTYAAIFNFVPGDVDGGANPLTFIAQKYDGSWSNLTEGTRTATSMQITGATSFSDFAMGQAGPVTIFSNGTGGGDWSLTATWAGGSVPTNIDSAVIVGTDSVWVLANTTCAGLNVLTGAKLSNNAKLTPTNVTLAGLAKTYADTLRQTGTMSVQNGGVYEHALNGGRIPTATWNSGSSIRITGVVGTAPNNGNQNFHHVIWNCPSQGAAANLNMGWDSITIGGNITVLNTTTGRWQMCGPVAGDSSIVTIMGDIFVSGGQFTTNGTTNALTKITIHHYGNVNVTGGNFSISRGSQGGSGTSTWYMHTGNFSMSNATSQNSNPTGAKFVFDKAGIQLLTLGAGNTLTALPVEVRNGTTFDVGTSVIRGSGIFTLNSGATLATGVVGGIDSTLAGTGTKTLSSGAGYTFNGATAQVTGLLLPAVVGELTISNVNNVGLSDSVFVSDTLHLTSGVLHTGSLTMQVGSSGTVERISGHVNGSLNKTLPVVASAGSQTYEIGDSTNYTPVSISGTSYAMPFEVVASTTPGEHPSIAGSGLDATKSVNRYYILTGSPTGPSNIIFNFVPGDIDGGANTSNLSVGKYNSPTWTLPAVGTRTLTSTEATGVTSFSDFAVAEVIAGAPGFTVSPASVSFGNVVKNDCGSDTVTVKNNGASALTVDSVKTYGGEFYVNPNGSLSIPAGDSASYVVTFCPTASGAQSGDVVFYHNAASTPDTVAVSGTGVQSTFAVNPTSVGFGSLDTLTSATDTVTVTNNGGAPLLVDSVRTYGGEFSVSPNGSFSVPGSGGTKEYYITFSPTGIGAQSGSVKWFSNSKTSPDSVPVTGAGVAAGPSPSFTTVSPDSIAALDIAGKLVKAVKRKKQKYPNWTNLLEEVVAQGGFSPKNGATEADSAGGEVIGISFMFKKAPLDTLKPKWTQIKQTSKSDTAWARLSAWDFKKNKGKSASQISKTMRNKTFNHWTSDPTLGGAGTPRGFDSTLVPGVIKRKQMKKQMTKLDPKKTPNKLFSELVALKFNIASSQLGNTPQGFGDLIYDVDSSMYDEMSLIDISQRADTMMTFWKGVDSTVVGDSTKYAQLYQAVYDVNRAFIGVLDTANFENIDSSVSPAFIRLRVNGNVDLGDVSFLKQGALRPTAIRPTSFDTETEEDFEDGDYFEDYESEDGEGTPVAAKLYQNYPNPFNPTTTISFRLLAPSLVNLKIYNILGQEVATLLNGDQLEEGYQTVQFNPAGLSSGVYFYQINAKAEDSEFARVLETKKMLLIK